VSEFSRLPSSPQSGGAVKGLWAVCILLNSKHSFVLLPFHIAQEKQSEKTVIIFMLQKKFQDKAEQQAAACFMGISPLRILMPSRTTL